MAHDKKQEEETQSDCFFLDSERKQYILICIKCQWCDSMAKHHLVPKPEKSMTPQKRKSQKLFDLNRSLRNIMGT